MHIDFEAKVMAVQLTRTGSNEHREPLPHRCEQGRGRRLQTLGQEDLRRKKKPPGSTSTEPLVKRGTRLDATAICRRSAE